MRTRLFASAIVMLVVAFSLVFAGEKNEKATKTTSTKKSSMHCCEVKDAKACTDKEMKDCDTKEAKASKKVNDTKAEVKKESSGAEKK